MVVKHATGASKTRRIRRMRATPHARSYTAVLEMPLDRDDVEPKRICEQAVLAALCDPECLGEDEHVGNEVDTHATAGDVLVYVVEEEANSDDDDDDDDASSNSSVTCSSWSSPASSSGISAMAAHVRRCRSTAVALPRSALDYWSYLDGIYATRRAIRRRIVDDLDADVEDGLREVPGLRTDDALHAVYARHARDHRGLRCAVGTRYDWFRNHMPLVALHVSAIARHVTLKAAAAMEQTEDERDADGCYGDADGDTTADECCGDDDDDDGGPSDYVLRVTDSTLSAAQRRRCCDSSSLQLLAMRRATEQIERLNIKGHGRLDGVWS